VVSSELLLLDDGCHCGRRPCSSTATTATLVVLSAVLFAAAAVLAVATASPVADYVAVAAWGLLFGGAATSLQSALTRAAGKHADVAQSSMVTTWNRARGEPRPVPRVPATAPGLRLARYDLPSGDVDVHCGVG